MRFAAVALLVAAVACASACAQQQPMPPSPSGDPAFDAGVARIPSNDGGVIGEGLDAGAGPIADAAGKVIAAGQAAVDAAKNALDGGAPVADISSVQLAAAPAIPPAPAFLGEVKDPADNATTPEKVQLGYQLFFDKRLSKSGTMSCESCHHPDKAWTSGEAVDKKDNGKPNVRNAPTMVNLGYHPSFYWDGRKPTLEAVTEAAWTGQLAAAPAEIAARLNGIATYRAEFQRAFHEDATAKNVPMALSAFLRALKSGDAPYDKLEQGNAKAVDAQVKRGRTVFEKTAHCTLCHVPPLYTDLDFHNVGAGASADHGRTDATKDAGDEGKFKTPTLREIARTGPYFHDGSVKTLDEAIEFMLGGGKGKVDAKLKPVKLSAKDRGALKAFLESLSGTATFDKAPDLP